MSQNTIYQRVLLIEDDKSHAFLISRALSSCCKELLLAETLAAGKQIASQGGLNLVVTDLNLPDSSQALSVKSIKEIVQDVPIIALTSSNLIQDAVEAMKYGASDFIVKDFGPDFAGMLSLALSRIAAAEELKKERTQLRAQMQALQSAIDNGSDAMAVSSIDGKITYYNKAFLNFVLNCRGNADNLACLFGDRVVNSGKQQESLDGKLKELADGSAWVTEIAVGSGSELTTFELNLSIVSDSLRKQAVIWVKDISNLKRREKFQRDMLATTTHDLKNPLSAISVSSELLCNLVKEEGKVRELVLRVGASAHSAINLIDEFLSARRIREGSFILKPVQSAPVAAIEEELENFTSTLAAKHLSFTADFSRAPATWKLDPLAIKRVLTNLMSNAIKFTPKTGSVSVKVSAFNDELHISVQDSGCGMEPSEVQKIFEKFSRLDKHADVAGSGLGLFVVKSIVAAHGGRVDVTSQPGKGTCFDVILPAEPPVNERGEVISLDFTA